MTTKQKKNKMKTLKEEIVEILYEEADENEFGESFVMLQESIVVDRLLSLFESYQAEQVKEIEGLKYTDFMKLDNTEIVGAKLRNIILDQVLEILREK